jgi:hypothetical protein
LKQIENVRAQLAATKIGIMLLMLLYAHSCKSFYNNAHLNAQGHLVLEQMPAKHNRDSSF